MALKDLQNALLPVASQRLCFPCFLGSSDLLGFIGFWCSCFHGFPRLFWRSKASLRPCLSQASLVSRQPRLYMLLGFRGFLAFFSPGRASQVAGGLTWLTFDAGGLALGVFTGF